MISAGTLCCITYPSMLEDVFFERRNHPVRRRKDYGKDRAAPVEPVAATNSPRIAMLTFLITAPRG
jgi:hypothetical protein